MRPEPATIVLTGASGGLGRALAEIYAVPGAVLHLLGRNEDRLAATAAAVRDRGAAAKTHAVEVRDREAMAQVIAAIAAEGAIDLVIANAGISAGSAGGPEGPEQTRAVFETNLTGMLNTVEPALAAMRERGAGQIALVSSMAGFRGMPGAPAYCGSKAAVRVWGEAVRGEMAALGIRISVICPGYVATPMTAINAYPMPFLVPAERAARIIKAGLARNRGRIVFPWPMKIAAWLLQALPDPLLDAFARRLPAKSGL